MTTAAPALDPRTTALLVMDYQQGILASLPGLPDRCLSNGLEHQAAKTLAAESSCDSMVGRGWLIQVLRGRLGALGGRRKRSGRAA